MDSLRGQRGLFVPVAAEQPSPVSPLEAGEVSYGPMENLKVGSSQFLENRLKVSGITLTVLLLVVRPGFCDLSNYLPLNVGNTWYYSHHLFDIIDSTGSWVDAETMSAEGTYSILHTGVIEGRTYYVFSGPPGTIPTPAHTLFRLPC